MHTIEYSRMKIYYFCIESKFLFNFISWDNIFSKNTAVHQSEFDLLVNFCCSPVRILFKRQSGSLQFNNLINSLDENAVLICACVCVS